jgi:hypothetical protein
MTVSSTTILPVWTGAQGEPMKLTKVIMMFIAALAINAAFAASARAQCGVSPGQNLNALNLLNGSAIAMPSTSARPATQESDARNGEEPTIVGLWDVKLISNNQIVDEGFDQFHSDGTEILNDTPPPAGGICLGVWAKTGPRSLKVKHPFWIFDSDTHLLIGRALLSELITLDRRGQSFRGTFTMEFRDLLGNPLAGFTDFSGNLVADRITVD